MVQWDGSAPCEAAKPAPLLISDENWRQIKSLADLPDKARPEFDTIISEFLSDVEEQIDWLNPDKDRDLLIQIAYYSRYLLDLLTVSLGRPWSQSAISNNIGYWRDLAAKLKDKPDIRMQSLPECNSSCDIFQVDLRRGGKQCGNLLQRLDNLLTGYGLDLINSSKRSSNRRPSHEFVEAVYEICKEVSLNTANKISPEFGLAVENELERSPLRRSAIRKRVRMRNELGRK